MPRGLASSLFSCSFTLSAEASVLTESCQRAHQQLAEQEVNRKARIVQRQSYGKSFCNSSTPFGTREEVHRQTTHCFSTHFNPHASARNQHFPDMRVSHKHNQITLLFYTPVIRRVIKRCLVFVWGSRIKWCRSATSGSSLSCRPLSPPLSQLSCKATERDCPWCSINCQALRRRVIPWLAYTVPTVQTPSLALLLQRTFTQNCWVWWVWGATTTQKNTWPAGQREEEVMHSCGQTTWACAPSCFLLLCPRARPNHWLKTTSASTPISKAKLFSLFLTSNSKKRCWGGGGGGGGNVETECKNALMRRLHCGTTVWPVHTVGW